MSVNYDIDYNDKRFTEVEADKKEALTELENTYGGMIDNSDKYYQSQIDASKRWEETQKKNQQAQTDFAIDKIEQQKDQAKKDYTKEQTGAYVDWQKQSNQYGANAEQRAAQGMANTGYSESSQVSMYNTYQNRVATAREAYQRAVLNYDNAIKDARLQNNSVLAEIAYKALQEQLQLSLAGFQYKNTLLLEQASKKTELEQIYHNRYQDVLKQINTENALAEDIRQHNENLAEEKRQYNESLAFQKEQFDWQKAQAAAKSSSGGSSGGGSIKKSSSSSSSSGDVDAILKTVEGKPKVNGSFADRVENIKQTDGTPTPDMNSILALGYGPIGAERLDELIKSGIVEEYVSDGKLKYRKSWAANKVEQIAHFYR